jgi:hypothetical protein
MKIRPINEYSYYYYYYYYYYVSTVLCWALVSYFTFFPTSFRWFGLYVCMWRNREVCSCMRTGNSRNMGGGGNSTPDTGIHTFTPGKLALNLTLLSYVLEMTGSNTCYSNYPEWREVSVSILSHLSFPIRWFCNFGTIPRAIRLSYWWCHWRNHIGAESSVLWNVTPCSMLKVGWRFGGIHCLYLHCLHNRLIDGGKVDSLTHRPNFTLQIHYFSVSGTHFC